MAVFVRRLFGIGKLPDELHAQLESEGLTYLADYVAVTRRFSGTIPGVRLPHSVASYTGSLVFTSERVLATLSMLPRLAGPTVNVRWNAPQTGAALALGMILVMVGVMLLYVLAARRAGRWSGK